MPHAEQQEGRRDQVEIPARGEPEAGIQMPGFRPVVIVQERDIQLCRVAAGPQQVVQAGVPRAGRPRGPTARPVSRPAAVLRESSKAEKP